MASLPRPSEQSSSSDHRLNYQSTSLRYNQEIKAALEVKTVVPMPSSRGGGDGVATDRDGVFLTWKDLWVTVSDGKKGSKSILQGLTGYARPGELLAIMGPSGCGKSTLLDTLAGRLGSSTRQTGDILINGHKQRLAFGTSAYVTQDDTLITTLTVKEAVYYSAQLQLPDSMTRAEKKERAEMIIREMGLQDAMNTRIGGWGSKGISGGQKRRVSICIEILTHPKLLFLDEPTSGLDSAASFYVMSRIARLDHKGENTRTVIASIHQPSGEVFQLFDSLCLLSAGKVVYFGSASQANEFFALNGFPCPTLQNPSDHFLKTINKDFETDLEQGLADAITAEVAINTLTKAYKSSDNYQQVKRLVTEICVKDCRTLEERSHSSFLTQCLVLTRRSFVNMYRDLGYYWLRVAIYVSLSLGLATLFYNLGSDNDSIQARGGGFFRLPKDLPQPFWKYPMYYIAFHKYAYQGMFKNEFEGLTFLSNEAGGPQTIPGENILRDRWQVEMGVSKWVDLAILLGMVVLYRILFLVIIKTKEKIKPIITAIASGPHPKQTTQVMEIPLTTPLHGDQIFSLGR
ncbi:hypothetical protein OIU77_016504 [Salix suchowensis]|uniref:ABC transporter domain-containing protein n=1 Tax=Salix suchowensis TaxID=1278906 RepID=A0ABQ8ZKP4_9ROSI|nr:hypothetical protein OIU77_016504 [Salix suchowensis]